MGAVDAEPAPIFAFAKNRYVQIGAVAIGAILLIALTVYALLRVPRVRDALRDVWPFKLMIQTARKKKAPARPFYDDSSCDDNDDERVVRHEPPALSALSRIVLLNEHAEKDARDERRAEPAVEECVDDARDERDEREHEREQEQRERDEQREQEQREQEQREEREKHEKRGAATFSRRKRAA
jgi:hypothetical protein